MDDKLIRDTIQDEINQLMSSKFAKKTDAQLSQYEKYTFVFSEDDITDMIKKYNDGFTTQKIGEIYNTNYHTISKLLQKNGVVIRGGGHKKVKVIQMSLNNELVQIHNSVTDAAKSIGKDRKSIKDCIKGKAKTCGGFIWKYVE